LIAALFGTALAPSRGHYGWIWGVAAGLYQYVRRDQRELLHGWMNLYNTGFSAGIVASIIVAVAGMRSVRGETEGRADG
jgi:hypothetical protein